MSQAIQLGRISSLLQSSSSIIFSSSSSIRSIKGNKGSVRLLQATSNYTDPKETQTGPTKFDNRFDNMDKSNNNPPDETMNVMEESFGAGYSTRSDEEGFGGIYGGNDECKTEQKASRDPAHHDSSQGSEVKQKEKARHQTQADS